MPVLYTFSQTHHYVRLYLYTFTTCPKRAMPYCTFLSSLFVIYSFNSFYVPYLWQKVIQYKTINYIHNHLFWSSEQSMLIITPKLFLKTTAVSKGKILLEMFKREWVSITSSGWSWSRLCGEKYNAASCYRYEIKQIGGFTVIARPWANRGRETRAPTADIDNTLSVSTLSQNDLQ